jgi:methylated-DNA-[protein]-cysteine S-methyltransferase
MPGSKTLIQLTMEVVETPLGDVILVTDKNDVLRATDFADCESRLRRLLDRRLGHHELSNGTAPIAIKRALAAYFAGDIAAIESIPISGAGTPFQESVWANLRSIAPGSPLTYGDLAGNLGRSGSARAVGHANGANPFCIVVPCHRLVGASGALTGYSGGIERKRWLLDHEARHMQANDKISSNLKARTGS